MDTKRARIAAANMPCYAIYAEDEHYSKAWGDAMVDLWIDVKKQWVAKKSSLEEFRSALIDGIVQRSNWDNAFRQAAQETGYDPDDDELYTEYLALHRGSVFDLLPANLHAELAWIPTWDGFCVDDLTYTLGLKSNRWTSNYVEDVLPDRWLEVFLTLVNVASDEVIEAAIRVHGEAGQQFARRCADRPFSVAKDPSRPSLLSGEQVVTVIENAYTQAIPMVHCFVNVRALFEFDPSEPMRITSDKRGEVHVGLHNISSGAGYMDTYVGQVIIPPEAVGFLGDNRMSYGVDKTYGLVTSFFYTQPMAVDAKEWVAA